MAKFRGDRRDKIAPIDGRRPLTSGNLAITACQALWRPFIGLSLG